MSNNRQTHKNKTVPALLTVALCLWVTIMTQWFLPQTISTDWKGWRQSDTQTIAQNFYRNNKNIFYPQIAWGGDGPGYVETEFQLYTYLAAKLMLLTGEGQLPSQLLSLLSAAIAACYLYRLLALHFPDWAAIFATSSFLVSRGVVFSSTSVQPDMLCLMTYIISLYYFLRWIDLNTWSYWYLWVSLFTLAVLIKPTAMSLGVIQLGYILIYSRQQLKKPALWLGWLTVWGLFTAHLYHAYQLYLDFGNTFGIIGGESKSANLAQYLTLYNYRLLINAAITWGIGYLALVCALIVLIFGRVKWIELLLAFAYALTMLIAFRYTSNAKWGSQYHLIGALPGAWITADAVHLLAQKLDQATISSQTYWRVWLRKAGVAVLLIILLGQFAYHLHLRQVLHDPVPEVPRLGQLMRSIGDSTQLAIYRSWVFKFDKRWSSINNFEDPRFFYEAGMRGWIIPHDIESLAQAKNAYQRGACYYAETWHAEKKCLEFAKFYRWLEENATLLRENADGKIYRFKRNSCQ